MVCFTEWLLSVLKETSRTGAMCTIALVKAWLCFLTFHWTCVALCFTEGLSLVPKTVLGVCAKETDKSESRKESDKMSKLRTEMSGMTAEPTRLCPERVPKP